MENRTRKKGRKMYFQERKKTGLELGGDSER